MTNQGTLAAAVSFSGMGIHTGQACDLVVRPAAVNSGRVFQTSSGQLIPARVDHVVSCDRSTILGKGDERVHTPEHLLSALASLGVDNARIEMTGPEVPILDGSSLAFVEAFEKAGVEQQSAPARWVVPERPFSVNSGQDSLVVVTPADKTLFEYVLHYDHPMLGCQTVIYDPSESEYKSFLAPARTFALWEEVKPLLERGMAQGGTIDNALVVYQDKFSSPLTVPQEPVRHKCLDLIGDFALLDARIRARVLAVKAGHRLHVGCAKLIWEEMCVHECA